MGVTENGTRQVMDGQAIQRALVRIGHEIVERGHGTANLALVGIRSRGVHIAQRLRRILHDIEGGDRRPVRRRGHHALPRRPRPPHAEPGGPGHRHRFSVDGRRILLVDDVLFTGRTIRAAMDAIIDFGRPQAIQLAVLVDRGHRELPIRADYVGKNIPTARQEDVAVRLAEADGVDEVLVTAA